MRCRFTNPATSAFYDFDVNPEGEEPLEQQLNIERTAPTSGVGVIRQQGIPSPPVLTLNGKILRPSQRTALQGWYELSRTQTVHFRDFTGNVYEVLITAFSPQRQRAAKNPRGGTDAPTHYWTYQMSMDIVTVISGSLP